MIKKRILLSLLVFSLLSFVVPEATVHNCTATWYDTEGHPKVYREHSTAAFNLYPKGTMLLVTNISNGKSDSVEITDRNTRSGVIIDLSKTSFSKIANVKQGVIKVSVKKIN